jgi:bifunctional DNA-binding transcriptional regulator/antitoxin component of YhaV-PrlF toxin-antitoxin module
VVPKQLRDELGISGPIELEIEARDGVIELAVPDVPARVEDGPAGSVIVANAAMNLVTAEDVREVVERTRR